MNSGRDHKKHMELDIDISQPPVNNTLFFQAHMKFSFFFLLYCTHLFSCFWFHSFFRPQRSLCIFLHCIIDNNQCTPDLKGKGLQDFLHALDIARRKYFFQDDSTPSCRLFEDVDDCGNEIIEPELWRPLGMDTETYNAKIENEKEIQQQIQASKESKDTAHRCTLFYAQVLPTNIF